MRIIIVKDYEELSKKAANVISGQVILKPNSVLGLATGSTPLGTYKSLVKMYKEGVVDFSKTITYNLDEYYGLAKNHINSYNYFMDKNLFSHINILKENIHIPNGEAHDIEAECVLYEQSIEKSGGIDLQLLGIGRNGHIGFNEPDLTFEALTHMVKLDKDTIEVNSRFFENIDDVPKKAISMGIKTIMRARKILLLASGIEKAEAVYKSIKGKITPDLPASVLQLHPDVIYILDEDAASLLSRDKE
ncbi:glucosamine-6-phosphate deaminase [Anaeromicrobium sediminis]|uniref:Glucosamine-6-phosphate deaminase n=1 Tax=Anaeromicrobium sediminis TaxID=1478221 RepID=A0A267MIC0_9FIRM|nr:glucosamine-6-phosphate deaminase [Anaeromicrobium sediminis]PAB59162.1 glucosamine-6-phosphate deaminase [Anaeromicrobium sediminis]